MDGFSPIASLSPLTLAIQHRAFAAADEIAQHDDIPEIQQHLRPLASAVEQLGQLATDLHGALESRSAVSPRLQRCLNQYLSACDPALASMTKQIQRIQLETVSNVDWKFVEASVVLLKSYNDLFAYLEEMLRVEDAAGQDASLDAPQGRHMIAHLERMMHQSSLSDILPAQNEKRNPRDSVVPAYSPTDAVDSSKAAMIAAADAPPPYEPAPELETSSPSSPPPPPGPATDFSALIDTSGALPPLPSKTSQGEPSHGQNGVDIPNSPTCPSRSSTSHASSSQAGSSKASSSQSGPGWDIASLNTLTRSFKALTSSLRSKPDPLVSALCQATTNGDVQQVVGLIKHGANINGRDDNGNSPLHCAIQANQGEAAECLLGAGADVTNGGWSKMPPLFLAASLGSIEVARTILNKGARVDQRSMSGQPYFIDVVASGNLEGVEFLLQNGANPNVSSINGRPTIVLATKKTNIEMVRLLIKHGAQANVTDMTGSSLLSIAADKGDIDLIDLILDSGADPNSRTINGVTVLTDAVGKGRTDLAINLLKRGADPNSRDLYAQKAIIGAVKDTKAPADKKIDLVRTMLQKGADVNATDGVWSTPVIWLAIDTGSLELITLLLNNGASTSHTRDDTTLLIYAIDKGEPGLAKLLLQAGADPNVTDKKSRTPLIQALVKQDVEMVKLLVQAGANPDAAGKAAPAELAKAFGNPEVVNALGVQAGSLNLNLGLPSEGRGRKLSIGRLGGMK